MPLRASIATVADQPELATNEAWRKIMIHARDVAGLTQKQLADSVGTSQNMISLIESGAVGSSQFIRPICRKLKIGVPTHDIEDEMREWLEAGRQLHADGELHRALSMVKLLLGRSPSGGTDPGQ